MCVCDSIHLEKHKKHSVITEIVLTIYGIQASHMMLLYFRCKLSPFTFWVARLLFAPGVDNNENFISISTSIFSKKFHNNGININIQSSNLQHQFWFQYYHLLSKTSKPTSILSTVFFNISMDIDISKWILEYHNDFNNSKLF